MYFWRRIDTETLHSDSPLILSLALRRPPGAGAPVVSCQRQEGTPCSPAWRGGVGRWQQPLPTAA